MSNDTRDSESNAPQRDDEQADPAKIPEAADDASPEADTAKADEEKADAAEASESAADDDEDYSPRRSPALIATAVALPIALVVGVLVMGVMANRNPAREALTLGAVQAPAAKGPECTALLPELPAKLGDYTNSELRQPAPDGAKAWQLPDGGDAIVLRCGLDRPMEFNRASPLQVVNGVSWFDVRDTTSGAASGTWWAVDRGTYIALTMPDNAGPTPLQEVSDAIKKAMPEKALDPNPLPN
ncbi:DUF3515 domain-containing protein [Nocardia sp. NPDC051030]|uniref:DUF3515 domain-containing protein n=1 Tax=Nocardia sp. NPDC051030 TaxID=3155162 RepID=UPI00343EB3C6